MPWREVFEHWAITVRDFAFVLHIDIEAAWPTATWRWFRIRLVAVLADPKSLLAQMITPARDERERAA